MVHSELGLPSVVEVGRRLTEQSGRYALHVCDHAARVGRVFTRSRGLVPRVS